MNRATETGFEDLHLEAIGWAVTVVAVTVVVLGVRRLAGYAFRR